MNISTDNTAGTEKKCNYFLRHWRGELSLPVSYWLNGFLANFVLIIFILSISTIISTSNNKYTSLIYWVSVILFAGLVALWQVVGIWRSSNRYVKEKDRHLWANAARLMVVIGLLSFLAEVNNTYIPAIKESLDRVEWQTNAKWNVLVLNNGREIELSGAVNYGIADDLLKVLSLNNNVETIHVNLSQGGFVDEAIKLQKIISQNKLSTYVSNECISACTVVFLGGVNRYLKSSAKLGFHAYSVPGVPREEMNYSDDKNYLVSLGIDSGFIDKIFNIPSNDMWYPTVEELIQANVINEIVDGSDFAISGTGYSELTQEIDYISNTMENLSNASTPEEYDKYYDDLKEVTTKGFEQLKTMAVSAESVQFVNLTEKQTELGNKDEMIIDKITALSNEMEKMDFDSADSNEQRKINDAYTGLCTLVKEHINTASEIINILEKKIELYKLDVVKKELSHNTPGLDDLLNRFRDNQMAGLEEDKKYYQELSCSEFLNESISETRLD